MPNKVLVEYITPDDVKNDILFAPIILEETGVVINTELVKHVQHCQLGREWQRTVLAALLLSTPLAGLVCSVAMYVFEAEVIGRLVVIEAR